VIVVFGRFLSSDRLAGHQMKLLTQLLPFFLFKTLSLSLKHLHTLTHTHTYVYKHTTQTRIIQHTHTLSLSLSNTHILTLFPTSLSFIFFPSNFLCSHLTPGADFDNRDFESPVTQTVSSSNECPGAINRFQFNSTVCIST